MNIEQETPGAPAAVAPRTAFAILNEHSGWCDGSGCSEELERSLSQRGIEVRATKVRGMDITAEVRKALSAKPSLVIAGGGDGTLNAVAQALRHTDIPLGLVPIGTLNHLARDLGVPLQPSAAIEVLPGSVPRRIDLGEVNGRIFLNNSIIGLYPRYEFLKARSLRQGRWKLRAILSAVWSVFRRNPAMTLRLVADSRSLLLRTPYVMIGNNEHKMEGYEIGNRESLDRGELVIYAMRPLSRWGLLKLAISLLFGRFRKQNAFETFRASHVRVETRRKAMGVALDGDVVRMRTPLEYRSLPGALTVLAPRN
jgi:diacylglycerol kinase family enzyme